MRTRASPFRVRWLFAVLEYLAGGSSVYFIQVIGTYLVERALTDRASDQLRDRAFEDAPCRGVCPFRGVEAETRRIAAPC